LAYKSCLNLLTGATHANQSGKSKFHKLLLDSLLYDSRYPDAIFGLQSMKGISYGLHI